MREAVGIWDESPLQKWFFRGPDALRRGRLLLHEQHGLARGRPVPLRRRSATSGARCSATASCSTPARHEDGMLVVTALPTDADHFRRVIAPASSTSRSSRTRCAMPHLQVQGPRSRELIASLTDADVAGLRYFRFIPEPITIGGVPSCMRLAHRLLGRARLRDLHAARERRAAVAARCSTRGVAGHPAVRPRGRRVAAHRVGPDLHRLRLLPGRDVAVPHEPRSHDQARHRRLRRQGRRSWPSSRRASRTAWRRS